MTPAVSAALAASAAALAWWRPSAVRHREGRRAPGPLAGQAPPSVAVAVAATAGLVVGAPLLLLPTVAVVSWAAVSLAGRARQERHAARRRERVIEAGEAMLGELRAGCPPLEALHRSALVWDELAPVAASARLGGDVPSALRRLGEAPGARALTRVAGAWQLCHSTGSGLATALEQVLATVRADHEVSLAIGSELSSARATARLLAVLPALVLAAAQGIGADPVGFLLSSTPGLLCLFGGVGLALAGVLWIERIADEARGEGA